MLADTVQSSEADAEMLGVVPGEELAGATRAPASGMAPCKTHTECYFHFLPILVNSKVLFGFLPFREGRY